MASRASARERYSFATLSESLELPDLIAVQRDSFEWFLKDGLKEAFEDISPIKGFSDDLQLELEFELQVVGETLDRRDVFEGFLESVLQEPLETVALYRDEVRKFEGFGKGRERIPFACRRT